ncbi:uncharacterized protein TM35_000012340, partial [Trypanosoma theileri]
ATVTAGGARYAQQTHSGASHPLDVRAGSVRTRDVDLHASFLDDRAQVSWSAFCAQRQLKSHAGAVRAAGHTSCDGTLVAVASSTDYPLSTIPCATSL